MLNSTKFGGNLQVSASNFVIFDAPDIDTVFFDAVPEAALIDPQQFGGRFGERIVEMNPHRPPVVHPGRLVKPAPLEGLDGKVQLARNRMGPRDCAVAVRWQSANAA